ncbi:MAG: DUF1971 domain-containing protein [Lentisphaeraceae bacterium]|nr:DUF1971 domain-containing protein [Lentisphaeraceae bacterium]
MKVPSTHKVYKKTPLFDQDSIPAGLRKKHNTAEGVWGRLVVVFGSVQFIDFETKEVIVASPIRSVAIKPQRWHYLNVTGPVELYGEFYKEA